MNATSNIKLERFFYVFVCAILLLAVLHWAQAVVLPVMMAVFLTFILNPVVRALQRFRLPRVVAVLVAATLLFAFIGCFLGFFFYQLNGLANDLPNYKTRISEKLNSVRQSQMGEWIGNAAEFIAEFKLEPDTRAPVGEAMDPIPVKVLDSPLPLVQTVAGTTLSFLVNTTLVFLLLIFMLMQREDLRNRLIRLGGSRHLAKTTRVFDEASQRISRFLAMQFVVNFGVGVALGAGLFVLQVPYAVVWGVLAAFSRYIPYLGAWLAAIFPLVATLAIIPGWETFFLVLCYIVVLELVTANVVEPIVFGHSIGVTGLALLIATVFWTWLWGPLGLFLATPLTAYLVVLGRHVPVLSFLPSLMGEEISPHPHLVYIQRLLAKDAEEAGDLVADNLKELPIDAVYDEILLPALNHALLEKERGSLDEDEERFLLGSTRAVLQDQIWDPAAKDANDADSQKPPRSPFIGVSGREDADALLLDMFKETLGADKSRLHLITSQDDDVLTTIENTNPFLILLVAWSNSELTLARRFCKQVRARKIHAKLVVCCWGQELESALVREKLTGAGADVVGITFAESKVLLQSFLAAEDNPPAATTIAQPEQVRKIAV